MQERYKNFTVLISNINRCIKKIKTEEVEEFKLKSPHVSCIYYLYKEKHLTAAALCAICKEDKAAMSRSVDYLEKQGLIVCDNDARKRYRYELSLTERGVEIGKTLAEKIDRIVDEASAGISAENRAIMYQCLMIINDNLEKICQQYEE